MNDLKLYYFKDYITNKGYFNFISYQGKTLAKFNKEKNRIDLSVLNPFVGKTADYYITNEKTNETKHTQIEISRLELDKELGWILYFDIIKEND